MKRNIALALTALTCLSPQSNADFVFDLADAVGGGNGSLPGTGTASGISVSGDGAYVPYAASPFIDGTFVPYNNATNNVIDGAGNTYNFDPFTSRSADSPYGSWYNGNNLDTDPSGFAGLPNFSSNPTINSLLTGHANKGITFDLREIRTATGTTPTMFTSYIGDSGNKVDGSISYHVFVDGNLKAHANNMMNDHDYIGIALTPTSRYLTIVFTDANNDITADHSYLGNPFLRTNAHLWTGDTNTDWSTSSNWSTGTVPTSGSTTEILIGGNNANSLVIPNPIQLNRLHFTRQNQDGTEATGNASISGGELQFVANGGFQPELAVDRHQTVTISNNLNIASGTSLSLNVINGPQDRDLVFNGQLVGSGTLVKTGAGKAYFNGAASSYTGNVIVNHGTLEIDSPSNQPALGSGGGVGRTITINQNGTLRLAVNHHNFLGIGENRPSVVINGGTLESAEYNHLHNVTMTGGLIRPTGSEVDGLDFRGTTSRITTNASVNTATIQSKISLRPDSTKTLILDVADGSAAVDLQISGQITSQAAYNPSYTTTLEKHGAGLARLTNANHNFHGNVHVKQGTLEITGRHNTLGSYTVDSGSNLVHSGIFGVGFEQNVATVVNFQNDGNSQFTGSLEFGLFQNGVNDKLVISGNGPFDVTQATLSLVDPLGNAANWQAGSSWDLFDGSPLNGTFASLNLPTFASGTGLYWVTSGLYESGVISIAPEPGKSLLFCAGIVTSLALRRRKSQAN